MKMQRILFVFVCLLLAIRSDSSQPQQGRDQIRVQTTLVNVPVMVSSRDGDSVLGLKAEDFVLYDDGVRQSLAFFVAAAEPIRVALLLDTSKSTITVLGKIRKAADGFVAQLRPQDEAMVASFDSEVHILCRWSSEGRELKQAIRSAAVGDYVGTKMNDAVALVVEKYLRPGRGRKAIILLTDGQDYGSIKSADEMTRAAVDAGVVVYPIFYAVDRRELAKKLFGVSLPKGPAGKAAWEETERAASVLLRRLADESAGVLYRSEMADLKKSFARVAQELRHQYLLAFYPDPSRVDGAQHRLTVAVSRSDLQVRARLNYRATAAAGVRPPRPQ